MAIRVIKAKSREVGSCNGCDVPQKEVWQLILGER